MAVVTDIRIQDTFFDNRKIVKLKRRHGADALLCLIRLWMYTAKNAPKGILFDMDDDDIEIAAGWEGVPGQFVGALVDLALVDKESGIAAIHDWETCQPWAFKSDNRSAVARLGGKAKAEKLLTADSQHADSMPEADKQHAGSNAPFLPSPLPPSPDLTKPNTSRPQADAVLYRWVEFVELYPANGTIFDTAGKNWWRKNVRKGDDELVGQILAGVARWNGCKQYQQGMVFNCGKWLNARAFEKPTPDEVVNINASKSLDEFFKGCEN